MPTTGGKSLTLLATARAVFRTKAPSQEQVQRVYELMKSGAIPVDDYGMSPLKWTTSEATVAEFLAVHQMHKAAARRRGAAPDTKQANASLVLWTEAHREESQGMHDIYRGIWRDYFLAVIMRRRMAHRSIAFHRAVLVGQVAVVIIVAGLSLGTLRGVARLSKPAEHAAIERWIEEDTDEFHITRWHPPTTADIDALEIRVEYRYRKESPRWIHTDRHFRVAGDEVTELDP